MPKNKLSPHDRFTRSLMSNPRVVQEFFQKNLPENIKKAVDFSSIKMQKESYIDDSLKQKVADLLYAVNFNGKSGFIYILIEHASSPNRLLPFRMLKYMVAIMDHHLNHTKKNVKKELPFIYPLILYSGKTLFTHSMDLFDLFPKEERILAKETLMSPFHLIDLTQVSDDELKEYLWFGTMALALKHIHDSDIIYVIDYIIHALKQLEKQGEESYIRTTIHYIVNTAAMSKKEEIVQTIRKLESHGEEEIMTIADYFKQEGIEKVAKAMLDNRMSVAKIASLTGLSEERIKELAC